MKRRELREHIFQLLFRVEFNGQEDMQEQVDLFVDDMKENGEVRPEDEAYISGKYQKIMERLWSIMIFCWNWMEGMNRSFQS